MSRLTKWENEHAVLFDYDYEEMNDKFYADNDVVDCVNLEFVLEKLAEYEDLEDKGLLLKLPCKVGDKVYSVTRGFISKYIICSIQKYTEGFFFNWKCEEGIYANTRGFTEFEIGKTVFLTKEEAEQKLKERKSDTNGKN